MNARTRLGRELIRHRRTPPRYPTLTRFTLSNGTRVRVSTAPEAARMARGPSYRATYRIRYATVYGPWPPTPELIRELALWG